MQLLCYNQHNFPIIFGNFGFYLSSLKFNILRCDEQQKHGAILVHRLNKSVRRGGKSYITYTSRGTSF